MFDFRERRKIRGWLFSKPAIALLFVVSLFLARSVLGLYEKERTAAERYAVAAARLEELKTNAALLEEKVAYLRSGRGMEEEIRRRFDVVKEGEQVVIIVEDEAGGTRRVSAETAAPAAASRPQVHEPGATGGPFSALWRALRSALKNMRD